MVSPAVHRESGNMNFVKYAFVALLLPCSSGCSREGKNMPEQEALSSNFCRSHEYWEDRYHRFYEERVRRGETHWLRALSGYYRFHLELAREILGRNPVWAPK